MKKHLLFVLGLAVCTSSAFAQINDEDCDPNTQDDCDTSQGSVKEPNHTIYPYKPFETSQINDRLSKLTEGNNYISDIRELDRRALNKASATVQPWGGSFWPLFQGMVANTYQDKDQTTFIFTPLQNLTWQQNYKDWTKRQVRVLPNIYELSEKDLGKLAPSEKYDILLGDTSFDLTNRVWDYVHKWGEHKKWSFLTKIDLPDGYRLPTPGRAMALWEGICHGWALGAGYTPRPEKTVTFTLPNGKKMPIYPSDIKALASLMWANSNIQDNILFEGNRCNKKNPDKDKFGRYIDVDVDLNDTELVPRCADVHPAIFHVAIVNVMGIEGRPIIIDHNPKLAIANQPVGGYEFNYFNPMTGRDGSLNDSMISVENYGAKDMYKVSRNPETAFIVGVHMNVKYIDWQLPKKHVTDSPADDKIVNDEFNYDLEINAQGKIIGGQWRVSKKGGISSGDTNQPDYFWLAPRNWKDYFKPIANLPEWASGDVLPPKEYQAVAKNAHSFMYEESAKFWGVSPKCKVFPINGKGDPVSVNCEFRYPKPQPLINVVDRLVELSKQ